MVAGTSFGDRRATDDPNRPPAPTYSNDLGVHALVWTDGWSEAQCRQACEGTSRLGYQIIEIPLLDPSTVDAAMTKRILAECNLKAATSACLTFHADISSADNDCAARGEELLNEALDTCVGLGGKIMCGNMYSALGKYDAPPTTQGRANAVAALKRVARRAADMGVTLGLEVLNRYETNLLNTAEQAMEFLAEVGVNRH